MPLYIYLFGEQFMPRRSLARLYRDEFTGYSLAKFQQDLLAGLTVAAVALPLALAFGVASGASAAAGRCCSDSPRSVP